MDGMDEFRKPTGLTRLLLSVLLLTSACSRSIRVPEEAATQENQAPFQTAGATQGSPSAMTHGARAPENGLPFDDSHTLPGGTLLTVRLSDSLTARATGRAQIFEAVVDQPVIIDGSLILPRGVVVAGRVESARVSELKPDRGYVRLALASLHVGGIDVPLQTASLFARQGSGADASLSTVRLEKGRRLTFRLTEPISLDPQPIKASR
jgi:hypothetical protein